MIYTNIKIIQDNIIERERPYWRMFQKDEKSLIAESVDIEGLTPKLSADLLAKELQNLEGTGYVIVKLFAQPPTKGGNNTGSLTYNVRIGTDEEVKGYAPKESFNFGMFQNFNDQINGLKLQILESNKNKEIEDLKRMYEEKSKKVDLDPTLKEIISIAKVAIFNKNNPGSHHPGSNNPGSNNPGSNHPGSNNPGSHQRTINGINDREEFIQLLKKWNELDPNYINVLKALVYFAQTNFDTYKLQSGMLIDQYNNSKK